MSSEIKANIGNFNKANTIHDPEPYQFTSSISFEVMLLSVCSFIVDGSLSYVLVVAVELIEQYSAAGC
jgi:hypothetical protein